MHNLDNRHTGPPTATYGMYMRNLNLHAGAALLGNDIAVFGLAAGAD